ncbi:MAG: hypothetical protein M3N21_03430, partial [Actinomycetota bacterium]|nr:hypothetical protein [Actinomycetota bacterium]
MTSAEGEAAGSEPDPDAPAARVPLLVQGFCSALLGSLLVLTLTGGAIPFGVVILVVQLVLARGFLGLVDAPAGGGAFLVAAGAAAALDAVAYASDGTVGGLAGVVALAMVAALGHQLLRRDRNRVIESLADTMVAVMLTAAAAALLALLQLPGGRASLVSCLWAAVVTLALGRAGDWVVRTPALAVGAT